MQILTATDDITEPPVHKLVDPPVSSPTVNTPVIPPAVSPPSDSQHSLPTSISPSSQSDVLPVYPPDQHISPSSQSDVLPVYPPDVDQSASICTTTSPPAPTRVSIPFLPTVNPSLTAWSISSPSSSDSASTMMTYTPFNASKAAHLPFHAEHLPDFSPNFPSFNNHAYMAANHPSQYQFHIRQESSCGSRDTTPLSDVSDGRKHQARILTLSAIT